jgi:VIT1/CCC1 family predicted Fe2+/Mn2+ transporter
VFVAGNPTFKIKMARSHHRKKHKEHLRQYQHSHETASPSSAKGTITGAVTIIGVILGAAIGYFLTDGVLLWVGFGVITGGLAGWLAGRYIDKLER